MTCGLSFQTMTISFSMEIQYKEKEWQVITNVQDLLLSQSCWEWRQCYIYVQHPHFSCKSQDVCYGTDEFFKNPNYPKNKESCYRKAKISGYNINLFLDSTEVFLKMPWWMVPENTYYLSINIWERSKDNRLSLAKAQGSFIRNKKELLKET